MQANKNTQAAAGQSVPLRCAAGLAVAIVLYGLAVWSPGTMFSFARSEVFVQAGFAASVANAFAFIGLGAHGIAATLSHAARKPSKDTLPPALLIGLLALCAFAWCTAFALENPQAAAGFVAALLAASCLSGVCLALAFVFWLERLKDLPTRQVHVALVAAAALSAVLNLPSSLVFEPVLRGIVVGLLAAQVALAVAVSRPCGRRKSAALSTDASHTPPRDCQAGTAEPTSSSKETLPTSASLGSTLVQSAPDVRGAAGDLVAVLVAAVVVTFVAPVVNTVLMVDVLELPARLAMSAAMNLATAALLAVVWLICKRTPSVFAVLLGFTTTLFATILLAPALGSGANIVALALGSAGFFLVIYLVMEAGVTTAQARHLSVAATYGTVAGVVMLARVLADLLSANLLNADIAGESKTLVATFLLVYLLTCAAFALYNAIARRRRQTVPGATTAPETAQPASKATAPRQAPSATPAELVSDAHNLSQREREVLVLIMRGRNVPAIAEELVLSRNTVQTHVRHIYEQLGVHSRQELVAYVEGFSSQSSNV